MLDLLRAFPQALKNLKADMILNDIFNSAW